MRKILISLMLVLFTGSLVTAQEVKETCLFGCRRRNDDGMAQAAAKIIANQQLQLAEAKVQSELLMRLLERGGQQAQQAADAQRITPYYQVPLPTAPYSVPGPTNPYAVPLPTAPYSVPGPTPAYQIPAPSAPYNVPGPSYEFRLQSPSGGGGGASPAVPSPGGGGMNIPGPGGGAGVPPLQPIPAPTSAHRVAWSEVRRQ